MSCTHILKRIGSFGISLLSGGGKVGGIGDVRREKKSKKKKLEEADPFL
jgi:hypothetical protein